MASDSTESSGVAIEADAVAGASQEEPTAESEDRRVSREPSPQGQLPKNDIETGKANKGEQEEGSNPPEVVKVTIDVVGSLESEYLKALEERLRVLEEKLQIAVTMPKATDGEKPDAKAADSNEDEDDDDDEKDDDNEDEDDDDDEKDDDNEEEEEEEDDEKDDEEGKKEDEDQHSDLDWNVGQDDYRRLKRDHNVLSYTEWRRMKQNESKKDKYNNSTMGAHVLDIVFDKGDVAIPPYPAHDEDDKDEKHRVLGRVRISSEAIIDFLNEITTTNLPTPCIMLHPFKILIEKEKEIRVHYQMLQNKDLEDQFKWEQEQKEKAEKEAAKASKKQEKAAEQEKTMEQEKERSDSSESGKDGVKTPPSDSPPEEPLPKAATDEERVKNATESKDEPKSKKERISKKAAKEAKRPKNYKLLHFERLTSFMDEFLKPEIEVAKDIKAGSGRKIYFAHLWHLFPPGELIYAQDPRGLQSAQIYQVVKTSGGRPRLQTFGARRDNILPAYSHSDADEMYRGKKSAFVIDCYHIDFDGKKFRPIQKAFAIHNYLGEMPVDALEVFPLRFVDDQVQAQIRKELLFRGRTFLGLTGSGASHREYTGMMIDEDTKEEIDSRIIVDFGHPTVYQRKEQSVPNPRNTLRTIKRVFGLGTFSRTDDREVMEKTPHDTDYSLYDDTIYDADRTDRLFSEIPILKAAGQALDNSDIGEQETLLLPGYVYAYVLRLRDFRKLDVTLVRDVQLNTSGFDDLVLPKQHRKLIKALVDRHSRGPWAVDQEKTNDKPPALQSVDTESENQQVDIVRGKGKGLIILLHGVPGVGKTSTAETIADATARPLLPVTCGDIGETATQVEEALERIFGLAHRWGCVLLMDEADVFLSKRRKEELQRNAVVSVFLRVLEYYSGILFLTTNRVGAIDEAFKSRIHISLYYPPLDWRTTKEIWRVNLRRTKDRVDADEFALLKFARKHFYGNEGQKRWNGRQIFNAFQTAIALAEFDRVEKEKESCMRGESGAKTKPKLSEKHFSEVAKTYGKFEDYLQETHGGYNDTLISEMDGLRADSFGFKRAVVPTPPPLTGKQSKSKPKKKFDSSDLPSTEEEEEDSSEATEESEEEERDSEEERKKKKGKKKREASADRKGKGKKGGKGKRSKKESQRGASTEAEDDEDDD